jgi:dihydroorotate dehydrogenase (fumarate)
MELKFQGKPMKVSGKEVKAGDNIPDFTVIGTGGIASAEDVVEFLLAGADAVQMLSAAMLRGRDLYEKIIKDLPCTLGRLGFSSIREVIETPLIQDEIRYEARNPKIDDKRCTLCGLCARICPYFALKASVKIEVDAEKCFGCGLCESRCPSKAISGVL